MFLAVAGLLIIFLFGLYSGHARQSKWPVAELVASCVVALLLVVLGLLYRQHTQGACLQPSYYTPYGSVGVCVRIFTFKNIGIGSAVFGVGLAAGLLYRLIVNIRAKQTHVKRG